MIIKKAKLFGDLRLLKASYTSYFCTSNQEIKYLRDRALLASNIIRRIWTKNKIDDLSHLPLHQSIVQYLESAKDIEDKARNELLNYFKNGVQLDGSVWYQKRIIDAAQQSTQNLTFYPTKIVTSQIFRRLLSPRFTYRCDKTLLTGNFGISKTFSVTLFAHLSNMVAEYNFKSYPTRQYLNDNSGIIKAPKVIYYSYLKQHILEDGSLRKIIINQLKSEVPAQKLPGFLNSKKFMEKTNQQESQNIRNFYGKNNVQAILIIDQISEYFSLLRRVRFKQVENINKENQTIAQFKEKLESFKGGFYQVVYLSSMDVEKDLLVQAELKHNQYQVQMDKIEYGKHLWKEEYMKQIIEIFLYLYEQKFKVNLFQKGPFLESLSKKLFEYLSSIRYSYFTSFLYMRQEVLKIAVEQKYAQQSAQNLENNILELFKNVLSSSEQKLAALFQSFVKKRLQNADRQIMNELIFQLYLQAHQAIRTGKKQTELFSHRINIIDIKEKYQQLKDKSSRQMESFNNIIFKQFFEVQQSWSGQIKSLTCHLPPDVIIKALQSLFPESLQFIASRDAEILNKYTKPSGKGQCIQILMLEVFKMSQSVTFFNHAKDMKHGSNSITFNNILQSNEIYGFQQIPKDKESNDKQQKTKSAKKPTDKNWKFLQSFSPSLSETIQKMKNSKDKLTQQSFVYTPFMNKYPSLKEYLQQIRRVISKSPPEERQQLEAYYSLCQTEGIAHLVDQSTNSKAIDFIMIEINLQSQSPLIKIHAFDATISKGKETQKLKKFIGQFLEFADRENNKIEIKLKDNSTKVFNVQLGYHVICPPSNHNILETLNKKFSPGLKFKPVEFNINKSQNKVDENFLKVQTTDPTKNYILKQVGCFDIYDGMQVNGNLINVLDSKNHKVYKLLEKIKQSLKKNSVNPMSKEKGAQLQILGRLKQNFLDKQSKHK